MAQNSQCMQVTFMKIRCSESGLLESFKSLALFFLSNLVLFKDRINENKKGLELVTKFPSDCKTFRKIPFSVIDHLGNFDNLLKSISWVIHLV